jgi:hypothetical protein
MAAYRASLVSSAPIRAAALLVCLLLVSFSSHAERVHGVALDEKGTQSSGTVGNEHARVGQTWLFALPVLHNISGESIEVTGASIVDAPKGIEVLGFAAYSLVDTEGLPLLVRQGDVQTPNFERLKDYSKSPVQVAAKEESEIFFQAKLKITAPPQGNIRTCQFEYRQGDRDLFQRMDCEMELKVH